MRTAGAAVTVAARLGRGVVGFGLGWVWCSAASLVWVAALALGYGGLDEGLSRYKDEAWAPVGFAAYLASMAGCGIGGTVGPVAVRATRHPRPVLTSSLRAGVWGGAVAAVAGAAVGWVVWQYDPQSALVLDLPWYVGVAIGTVAGLRAGRAVSRAGFDAV